MNKLGWFVCVSLACGNSVAGGLPAERQYQYKLMMNKHDKICRPLLRLFNQNIRADLVDLRRIDDPFKYRQRPQPMPKPISVQWETIKNSGGSVVATVAADIDGNGSPEIVERRIDRLRRDGISVSLWFMPKSFVPLSAQDSQESYQAIRHAALMVAEEKDYVFSIEPYSATTLNAFDLIQFGGKFYLTARSHILNDELYFIQRAPQWRVVLAIKTNSSNPVTLDGQKAQKLTAQTEAVCHFLMKSE